MARTRRCVRSLSPTSRWWPRVSSGGRRVAVPAVLHEPKELSTAELDYLVCVDHSDHSDHSDHEAIIALD
jgi:hypothetical protein